MRDFAVAVVIAVLVSAAAACGGNKEAEQAAASAQAGQPAGGGSPAESAGGDSMQDMARSMEQLAQGMQQLQTGADGKPIEVVAFRDLQNLLPQVSGWSREEPSGETMSSPVRFSQAEAAYTRDDARVELRIVDTATSQLLIMPYQMFLVSTYARETGSGYEKAVKIGGFPGWEKWDGDAKQAEVGLIVGQRFLVTAEGNNVDSARVVQDVVAKVDLARLASLK